MVWCGEGRGGRGEVVRLRGREAEEEGRGAFQPGATGEARGLGSVEMPDRTLQSESNSAITNNSFTIFYANIYIKCKIGSYGSIFVYNVMFFDCTVCCFG